LWILIREVFRVWGAYSFLSLLEVFFWEKLGKKLGIKTKGNY